MLHIKTKESFQFEVRKLMGEYDLNILEAMTLYSQKYGLDEHYVVDNLLSPGLKEQLQEECEAKNIIKRTANKIDGI